MKHGRHGDCGALRVTFSHSRRATSGLGWRCGGVDWCARNGLRSSGARAATEKPVSPASTPQRQDDNSRAGGGASVIRVHEGQRPIRPGQAMLSEPLEFRDRAVGRPRISYADLEKVAVARSDTQPRLVTKLDEPVPPRLATPSSAWWPASPAGDVLRPPTKVVPFVGAGISIQAGLPSAGELAENLRSSRYADGVEFDRPDDPRHVVDAILAVRPRAASTLQRRIARLFDITRYPDRRITPPIAALARAPSRWVVTLNYDELIGQAAQEQGIPYTPILPADFPAAAELLREDEPPETLQIVHLHGACSTPASIVLNRHSYAIAATSSAERTLLTLLRGRMNLCFFGLSLDEVYLLGQFAEQRPVTPQHVYLGSVNTLAQAKGRAAVDRYVHGIVGVELEHGWPQLDEFIPRLLRPAVMSRQARRVRVRQAGDSQGIYVDQALVDLGDSPFSSGINDGPRLTERDLVSRRRTVLQGLPGAGKTTLLHRLIELVPFDEIPVFLPLGLGLPFVGETSALFRTWLRSASDGTSVDADVVLTEGRLHVLFDGLDELPAEAAQDFLVAVSDVANLYPQHRYTVATRPIEALSRFPSDWQHVDLVPTFRWRDEYLARNRLSWQDVEQRAPSVSLLGAELFMLPLFLSGLVRLWRSERTAEPHDALDVLAVLLDDALGDDSRPTAVSPQTMRSWLERVALWMLLSARVDATNDELIAIPLPEGLRHVGVIDEIVRVLLSRSILAFHLDRYRWAHRVLGEGLAAKAIASVEDTEIVDVILDVLAPAVSRRVRGVRGMCQVPATLLLSHSDRWRELIEQRDPVFAANSVPATAAPSERRRAAERLWQTYLYWEAASSGWGGHPDEPRTLGILLRAPDLSDLLHEVATAAAEHQSDTVRTLAAQVLGHAMASGRITDLVRTRLRGEPSTEVRVAIARAAARANVQEVVDDIWQLAMQPPTDELERSALAHVVVDLAPDDELLARSMALAHRTADRGYWPPEAATVEAWTRLPPKQQLEFVFLCVATGVPISTPKRRLLNILPGLATADDVVAKQVAYVAASLGMTQRAVRAWLVEEGAAILPGLADAAEQHDEARGTVVLLLRDLPPAVQHEAERIPGLAALLPEARNVTAGEGDEIADPEDMRADDAAGAADDEADGDIGGVLGWAELSGILDEELASDADEPEPPEPLAARLQRRAPAGDRSLIEYVDLLWGEASELAPNLKRRLQRRLQRWWPTPGSQVSDEVLYAWKAYGAGLNLAVEPQRWLELALFPREPEWFDRAWLSRHWTPALEQHIASSLTEARTSAWNRLLQYCPPSDPSPSIEGLRRGRTPFKRRGRDVSRTIAAALVERVRVVDESESAAELGRVLVDAGRVEDVRTLAAANAELGRALDPCLAAAGDVDAVDRQFRLLLRALRTGKEVSEWRLFWLDEIADPRWLPALFDCVELVRCININNGQPGEAALGAIQNIGGEAALEAYDNFLAGPERYPGAKTLRHRRNGLLDEELNAASRKPARVLAARLGLPEPDYSLGDEGHAWAAMYLDAIQRYMPW
jgi:hypothetical protein